MKFTPIASSSKGNAYLVECGNADPLLIECGIPIRQLKERLWLSGLAGCLVSHQHMDHARALPDLLKASVDVWCSRAVAEKLNMLGHYRITVIDAGDKWRVGPWTILPFDVHHDVPTQGFMIGAPDGECLLFIPDSGYVEQRFQGVTIAAVECNFNEEILTEKILAGSIPAVAGHRIRRYHSSLDVLVGMLKANDLSRCRQIWLLHLSDGNSDETRMVREVQEATGVPVYACEV
jgi:phosphoribosyl 1,2-cyclic phosphodiesterase